MIGEEHLAIFRQSVEAGPAGEPEQLPRATIGQVVVRAALEERPHSFGEAVAADALEAVVPSLRKRLANAAAGVRVETKRGIGYRLVLGGDA